MNRNDTLEQTLMIIKALADKNRVRAIMILEKQELCVCQIMAVLGLAPSTVSKHMSILHQAGLVDMRKDGRWHYYRLSAPENEGGITQNFLQYLFDSIKNDPQIKRDQNVIRTIQKLTPDELCVRLSDENERQRLFQIAEPNAVK